MRWLIGFGCGYGRNFFMAPAGDDGGAGGGGGGAGGGTGGGSGAGGAGEGGGEVGQGGGMFAGQGGEGGGGTGMEGGALGGAGGKGGQGGEGGKGEGGAGDGIDWEHVTDDEFFGKVDIPKIDGVNVNLDFTKKTYGEFIRKHHISPEAVKDFVELEGKLFKKTYDGVKAKEDAETKAIKENFEAQGAALKKAYSQEQIDTAVGALATFSEDKDFMQIATTNLSNNPTLVKLLLNWAEHHKVDDNTGAGQGQGSGGLSGFAERWTGKKI